MMKMEAVTPERTKSEQDESAMSAATAPTMGAEHSHDGAREAPAASLPGGNSPKNRGAIFAVMGKTEGFSLMEMLIVIALIGMLAALVGGNLIGKFNQAKVDTTRLQMKQLSLALDDFNRVCGFYPSTDQGLDALITKPQGRDCKNYPEDGFIKEKKVPKDAWSNDFIYTMASGKFEIKSLGADGKEGGEKNDADLSTNDTTD